jgi:nucleotide-binding universal stress UspA family protein
VRWLFCFLLIAKEPEMAIKDIMMVMDTAPDGAHLDEFTLSLAQQSGAHVTAVGHAAQTIAPVSFVGDYPYDLIVQAAEEARAAAQSAAERLSNAAPAGVATDSRILEGLSGQIQGDIGRAARNFDLTIIRQCPPDEPDFNYQTMISVLFSSGRPVVVLPYIHKGPANLKRAMVAWDGGMVAARAVAGAMPFLASASSVEVVNVSNTDDEELDLPGFNITHHLARHGIDATLKRLTPGDDMGSTLLSHAADTGADFIVMGSYGHSRLREFVLGGTTRTILDSMTIPVVTAH